MGAVRSENGSLHTDQSAALLRARKIPIEHAQTPPYGSTPLFMFFGHPHAASRWSVKSTNRHKTDSELLTNS